MKVKLLCYHSLISVLWYLFRIWDWIWVSFFKLTLYNGMRDTTQQCHVTYGFFLLLSGCGDGDRFLFLPGPPLLFIPLSWSPSVEPCDRYNSRIAFFHQRLLILIQWNLVIKRSDITKPFYNKVILLVPALYISLFFTLI